MSFGKHENALLDLALSYDRVVAPASIDFVPTGLLEEDAGPPPENGSSILRLAARVSESHPKPFLMHLAGAVAQSKFEFSSSRSHLLDLGVNSSLISSSA